MTIASVRPMPTPASTSGYTQAGDVVKKLVSELLTLTKENRSLAVRRALQAVQEAQERKNAANKQWQIALTILRKVAGSSTFEVDNHHYQIRVRDGKPFICSLDKSPTLAAA